MKPARLVCLIVLAILCANSARSATIFDLGSSWAWLHPTNGVDPAIADPDFNSATNGWMADIANFAANYNGPAFNAPAPGLLGYGGITFGPTATNIGEPTAGMRYSAYFRKVFNVAAAGNYYLDATALVDDGAILYIDGVEAGRVNMDRSVADTYQQFSTAVGNEASLVSLFLNQGNPLSLAAGSHVLAVSLHNAGINSTDLGFDLRLNLSADPPPGGPPPPQAIDFATSALGDRTHASQGGSDLGWTLSATSNTVSAVRDSTSGTPAITSAANGKQLLLNDSGGIFEAARTDVRNAIYGSYITWDFRTFENDPASDWEQFDSVRFSVEGSTDGLNYFRIPGVDDIVLSVGIIDQLKPLELAGEAFTSFAFDIPPFNGFIRFGMLASGNVEPSEYFVFDNLRIEANPVPEPSGAMLALVGLSIAGFRLRRRRPRNRVVRPQLS